MVKLGDVCEILSGYAFDSQLFIDNHNCGMPLIRIRDIVRGFTQTYTTEKYDEKYIIKSGDLLIGMDGEFNIALWKNENALLNQRVCKIKSISSNRLSEKYLFYFMPKALKQIEQSTSFVTVKHLSVKTIYQIEIPLPPLDVQNKIANTLDKAQEIIDGHKKQLGELDSLIKAIFYDMFGDPVTNERGWRVEKLSEKSILQSGGTPPREKIEYFNGTIPWITTVALNKLFIGHDDANEYISEEAVNNSATKIIPAYSILFGTRVGVGKVSINIVDMCTNQDVVAITNIDDKCLNKTFLIETLKKFSGYYNEQKRGATIKGITSSVLKETEIILPSLHLQNKFATIVTNIEEQKAIVKKSIEESKTLFYSLMNKYFE